MKTKILRRITTVMVFLAVFLLYMSNMFDFQIYATLLIVVFAAVIAAFYNLIWRLFELLSRDEKRTRAS